MKTSIKILAASVALATLTLSGVANASIAISTSGPTGIGSGEIYLTAWDQTGLQSYSRDLGVFEASIVANPGQRLSYNLNKLDTGVADANWVKFITSGNKGAGVIYTITGANISDSTNLPAFGFVSTSPSPIADFVPSVGKTPGDVSVLANTASGINMWAENLNADAGDSKLTTTNVNLSSRSIPGDLGYSDTGFWGINAGGKTFLTIGDIGSSVAFYSALVSMPSVTPVITKLPNVWKLDTAGNLTYAPVSSVPIPAAVWLFGSGLLGLVGVARRRKV